MKYICISYYGGRSSVGRASACGAEGRRFKPGRSPHLRLRSLVFADVAELVDALDLGSSVERRGGSIPSIRTNL